MYIDVQNNYCTEKTISQDRVWYVYAIYGFRDSPPSMKESRNPFWLALGAGLLGAAAAWAARRAAGIVFPVFIDDALLGPVFIFFLVGLVTSIFTWAWLVLVRRAPRIRPFGRASGCVSALIFLILSGLFSVFLVVNASWQVASQPAPSPTPAPTATASATPLPAAPTRAQATPTPLPTPTSTPQRESQAFRARLRELAALGYAASAEGAYQKLPDFNGSLAQIDRFQSFRQLDSLANFILRAEVRWESASLTPNTASAGCGFSFHETDRGQYVAFLAMDGTAHVLRVQDRQITAAWQKFYQEFGIPADSAELLLLVNQNRFVFLVDGVALLDVSDDKLPTGALGITVHSGTNKDFGTRCVMENVELVELP